MTVKDIIAEYLRQNGFTGLRGDDCGCGIDDICPLCAENILGCEPGYVHDGTDCGNCENLGFACNFTNYGNIICHRKKEPVND